jgi:hypothetical protein
MAYLRIRELFRARLSAQIHLPGTVNQQVSHMQKHPRRQRGPTQDLADNDLVVDQGLDEDDEEQ